MVFDLDAAMELLLPWDLQLKIGGKVFKTKPPTVGQLASIDALGTDKSRGGEARFIAIIGEMFEDPAGAMSKLTVPALPLAAKKILKYAEEYTLKNSQAVANAMGDAAAVPALKSGSSSPLTSSPAPAAATP